jgi:hypothetical protein
MLIQLAEFVHLISDALKLLGMQLPTQRGPRIGFKSYGILFPKHRTVFSPASKGPRLVLSQQFVRQISLPGRAKSRLEKLQPMESVVQRASRLLEFSGRETPGRTNAQPPHIPQDKHAGHSYGSRDHGSCPVFDRLR